MSSRDTFPLENLDLLTLRRKLRKKGIVYHGTKAELIDRLKAEMTNRLKENETRRMNESILERNTVVGVMVTMSGFKV